MDEHYRTAWSYLGGTVVVAGGPCYTRDHTGCTGSCLPVKSRSRVCGYHCRYPPGTRPLLKRSAHLRLKLGTAPLSPPYCSCHRMPHFNPS
jgi:hypothetical protein